MSEWKCKEPESCFVCPFRDCIKHIRDLKHKKSKKGSTIIASFPNNTVGYFHKNEVNLLAEKLKTSSEVVLEAVNGDGWYNGTFMVWGEKPNKILSTQRAERQVKKLIAYWGDGRTRQFDSITIATEYFHVTRETLRRRIKHRVLFDGVIVLECGSPAPTSVEFSPKRAVVDKNVDIPVPEDNQVDDTLKYIVTFDDGSTNEYFSLADIYRNMQKFWGFTKKVFINSYHNGEKLKGIRSIVTKGHSPCQPLHKNRQVLCKWSNGEARFFRTAAKAAEALCISASTVTRYLGTNRLYRGVLFEEVAG